MSNNLIKEDNSYLCQENGENILVESDVAVSENNFQFVGSHFDNTGIISVTEKAR